MNKKVIAAAVAGLFVAAGAQAEVIISTKPVVPVPVASELVVASTGTPILNAAGALNLTTALGYAFSFLEVRYVRIECSSNIAFAANSTVSSPNPNAQIGAINGLGTNAIHFSITDLGGIIGTDTISVLGNRILTENKSGTCSYDLYDQPSQAANGGTAGQIVPTVTGAYIASAPSIAAKVTPFTATANVEATPTFSDFVVAGATTLNTAQLASVVFDLVSVVDPAKVQPIIASGVAPTLAALLGANTTHIVAGDWSAAANADGTFTGAALDRVFFGNGACVLAVAATTVSATSATFKTGDGPVNAFLCYTPLADVAIPASDYLFTADLVADSAAYVVQDIGPVASGSVVRNGTQLQAPLAQIPTGYISRMVLTNTGSLARPYAIKVQGETGNTIGTANLTGTVPANGTTVVDLTTVLTSFTGAPRATLNVTVAGPNNQIQGLYQIVNPASGGISNHVMVRPGSN